MGPAGRFPSAGTPTSLALMTELAGWVADAFEPRVRDHEERWLSPLAVRSTKHADGHAKRSPCRLRTPFQRDRDRIVHSKAFRRLRNKTQVFIDPGGDHFRTRITHTVETTGISRGVGRALGLNEDLVEAIGLGHDLGHRRSATPARRARPAAQERFGRGFRHSEHSLRIVDVLEKDGQGLNLTAEVRDGILSHTGRPSRRRSKERSSASSTASPTSTTTSTTRSGPASSCRTSFPGLRSSCSARQARDASTRSSDLVETSQREGDIRQSEEDRHGDARAQDVHVRARLPRAHGGTARARP